MDNDVARGTLVKLKYIPDEEHHMERIGQEGVERVARIYASNKDASQALGITLGSFGRLCRKFGIETPYARRRRRLSRVRSGSGVM